MNMQICTAPGLCLPMATNPARRQLDTLNSFLAQVEKRAYKMAYFAVGERQEALDIVQEAMLKLAEKYARKPVQEWAPLFYRILYSKIHDSYRRKKRQRLPLEAIGELPSDTAHSPHGHLVAERFALALEKALWRLPERQREVFLLRVWQGLDISETAKALRCSGGSVKTHYFRALRQLRAWLNDYEPYE